RLALRARRYRGLALPAELRRKLVLLELGLSAPPPSDPAKAEELTRLQVGMQSDYGKGTYCRERAGGRECLQINQLSKILAESRDPAELLDAWQGWHRVG